MTDVIDERSTEQGSPHAYESLPSRQTRLLALTNWAQLLHDYVQPPIAASDEYVVALDIVPTYVFQVAQEHVPADAVESVQHRLSQVEARFINMGYIRHDAQRNNGDHPQRPNMSMTEYVDNWLLNAEHSQSYMTGSRHKHAQRELPTRQLRDLATISQYAPQGLPQPIDDALWQNVYRITSEYDAALHPERHGQYHDVRLAGTEYLPAYGMSAAEFTEVFTNAQLSYPSELLRGLQTVHVLNTVQYMHENGRNLAILGEVRLEGSRMDLYPIPISQEANYKFTQRGRSARDGFVDQLEQTLDHELAHIAHMNAPPEWLRRWEELNRRRSISISAYADHAHQVRTDGGRAELFAEAVRVYRGEPLDLMYMSDEHFVLIDELMRSYDKPSVDTARELIRNQQPVGGFAYHEVERMLSTARQLNLNRRIDSARRQGTKLGRVIVLASSKDNHRPIYHQGP